MNHNPPASAGPFPPVGAPVHQGTVQAPVSLSLDVVTFDAGVNRLTAFLVLDQHSKACVWVSTPTEGLHERELLDALAILRQRDRLPPRLAVPALLLENLSAEFRSWTQKQGIVLHPAPNGQKSPSAATEPLP